MNQFEVGEVAILCNFVEHLAHLNGQEATITGPLDLRLTSEIGDDGALRDIWMLNYLVDVRAYNRPLAALPAQLRKKDPPGADNSDKFGDETPNKVVAWDPTLFSTKKQTS